MKYWLNSFSGLFFREISRFMKVPSQTVGTPIISSLLYLLIFGISLGPSIDLGFSVTYLAFLVPGLTMMFLIKNAFENSSSSLITGKYLGELQDLRIVPLDTLQIASALALSSFLRGLIIAILTFCFGELCHLKIHGSFIPITYPGWFVFFLTFGGISFSFLGIAVGMTARSFEHVSAISSFVLTPLLYLGGIFIPINSLHPIWQYLSYGNPLLYVISGLRYGIIGYSDVSIHLSCLVTILSLFFFAFFAITSLRKGRNYFR